MTGVMFADKAYFLAFKAVAKSPAKTTACNNRPTLINW